MLFSGLHLPMVHCLYNKIQTFPTRYAWLHTYPGPWPQLQSFSPAHTVLWPPWPPFSSWTCGVHPHLSLAISSAWNIPAPDLFMASSSFSSTRRYLPFNEAEKVKVKVAQSCPSLCDPMNCVVHGILQARILEWAAFLFSRRSCQPRDWTQVSCIAGKFFTIWATREAQWSYSNLNDYLLLVSLYWIVI